MVVGEPVVVVPEPVLLPVEAADEDVVVSLMVLPVVRPLGLREVSANVTGPTDVDTKVDAGSVEAADVLVVVGGPVYAEVVVVGGPV